jgi:hypothetical protein
MPRLLHGFVTAIVSVAITGAASGASAQDQATEQFIQRVNAYMEFRSDFVEVVPPLVTLSDAQAIEIASNALAVSLRAARPQAKIGDIFTPEVVAAFRQRIDHAIEQQSCAAADLVFEMTSEAPAASVPLAVNARFDWAHGAATPGFLIAALPALPDELQYRFIGGDLVLVDVPARLIVDIMPVALVVD